MPVQSVDGKTVHETGSVTLKHGETKALLSVGSHGGKLLFEADPGVSAVTPGAANQSGLIHYRLPVLGSGALIYWAGAFSLGTENFELAAHAHWFNQDGLQSMKIDYTILSV